MQTQPTLQRPLITSFSNSREFLKEQFQYLKSAQNNFSFYYCARKMKTSASYLKSVFAGRRRLGLDKITVLSRVMKLDAFETRYLTLQVIKEYISDPEVGDWFEDVLKRLQSEKYFDNGKLYTQQMDVASSMLTDWLTMTIIELVAFPDFQLDAAWIHSKLIDQAEISPEEIENRLKLLAKHNIIQKGQQPKIMAVANPFQPASLEHLSGNFKKTLAVLPSAEKYKKCRFFTGTIALNAEGERKLFDALLEFERKIQSLQEENQTPDRVIAISIGAFNTIKKN